MALDFALIEVGVAASPMPGEVESQTGTCLDFVAEEGEARLEHAYELGRRAMADGEGINDVAAMHWNVLDDVRNVEDLERRRERSFEFLTEAPPRAHGA